MGDSFEISYLAYLDLWAAQNCERRHGYRADYPAGFQGA
jgi:hypothetical protein